MKLIYTKIQDQHAHGMLKLNIPMEIKRKLSLKPEEKVSWEVNRLGEIVVSPEPGRDEILDSLIEIAKIEIRRIKKKKQKQHTKTEIRFLKFFKQS